MKLIHTGGNTVQVIMQKHDTENWDGCPEEVTLTMKMNPPQLVSVEPSVKLYIADAFFKRAKRMVWEFHGKLLTQQVRKHG